MASTSPENGSRKKGRGITGPHPKVAKSKRLDVPAFYAAGAQILVSGNDASLLFTTPHPMVTPEGELATKPLNEPVVLIHMSLAGLKELSTVAADIARRIEQAGSFQSDVSRREHVEQVDVPRASISRH